MENEVIYESKSYKHLDYPTEYETVKDYVTNLDKISRHSFLPFIKFEQITEKMTGIPNPDMDNRPVKRKVRPLMYAGHLDGFIYKYYSDLLNEQYNLYAVNNGINDNAIAYRSNDLSKTGKSTINFAAEVISFITNHENVLIIIGDFSDYFGTLHHQILKENLCRVLGVERLPKDWFNVYRSLTKFGYYQKETLETHTVETKKFISFSHNSYFKSVEHFRRYQRIVGCEKNTKPYGIPQGSALSAVLSNVYAIDFDNTMNSLAEENHGIYRRYSDDYIMVIPNIDTSSKIAELLQRIRKNVLPLKITINKDKEYTLIYTNKKVIDARTNNETALDYLGFVFNGESVRMRSKSTAKFYRKARKLINKAKYMKFKNNLPKLPYRKQIYGFYTDMNLSSKERRNFISYAKRCQMIFDQVSPRTDNLMMQQIANRKTKIERVLGYRIHV